MRYLSVEDIRTHLKDDNGWANTTTYDDRITRAIQRAVEELETTAHFDWTIRSASFAVSADTEKYALPYDFREEVQDTVFHKDNMLGRIDPAGFKARRDAIGAQTDSPKVFNISGMWPVEKQPSSASAIRIVIASSVDSGTTITVRGLSGGVERYEAVAPTTQLTVDTSLQFTELFDVSKRDTTTGLVKIYEGATLLLTIPPQAKAMNFMVIRFDPIPNGTATVTFEYYRNLGVSLQLGESVPLPASFERLIYTRVLVYIDEFRRDWEAHRAHAAQFLDGRETLKGEKREPTGFVHPAAR